MTMGQMAWARALDNNSRDFYNRGARQRASAGYGDNPDGPRPAPAPRDSMIARNDWPCRFDGCGDRTVTAGVTVIVKRGGKWGHQVCPERPVAPSNPPDDSHTPAPAAQNRRSDVLRGIPHGTYTVRPADESAHVVLSVEPPSFGNFPDGTMAVSVHGSFAPVGRDGIREHRSWLGIGLAFPDGRFNLYRNVREMISQRGPGCMAPEDRPAYDKAIRGAKAVRLLLDAGADQLMAYGKAWAMAEQKCFVCHRPLTDEESQRDGIGPVCAKRFREIVG